MTSSAAAAGIESYPGLQEILWNSALDEALRLYEETECRLQSQPVKLAAARRELGLLDRYYLLLRILRRRDVLNPWIYARCREVEADPDGRLDLWPRFHYKSSTITFAGAIQEILKDQEITIGIFSHTRPIAKGFLRQIKRELEVNEDLKSLYPDILYVNPAGASPQWSEDGGIVVKRQGNPKEATLEAWGLVDGQPTAKHFGLRIYDDVVTRESVTTPEQIQKTTEALDLSQALSTAEGRAWYVGTYYSFADTYHKIAERGTALPRVYAATDNGERNGSPVLLSEEKWAEVKRDTSEYVLSCQFLLNPLAGSQAMFQPAWLENARLEVRPETMDVFILCDPAGSRKTASNNTAMAVIGTDSLGHKFLVDGLCHKLDLGGRWTELRRLYTRWRSMHGVLRVAVGYERYGMQSDLEYFEEKMREPDEVSFPILELAWPREGPGSKEDRVQRMVPDMREGKVHLPSKSKEDSAVRREMRESGHVYRLMLPIKPKDQEGHVYDLGERLVQETTLFPFGGNDDLIDAVSRIYDMDVMGTLRVFAVDEAMIRAVPIQVPAYWPRICGLYFGRDVPTTAVWVAWDKEQDTVYVVDAYRSRDPNIAIHAAAIKGRGSWIPVAWPETSIEHTADMMGPQVAKQFREQGLKMRPESAKFPVDQRHPDRARTSPEAGVSAMLSRMQSGRLKVFAHLGEWVEDLRGYCREDGKLPRSGGSLLSATRIALMELRHAVVRTVDKPLMREQAVLDRTMGY